MNTSFSRLKVKPPILIVIVLAIILGIIAKVVIVGGPLRAKEEAHLVEVINQDQTFMTKETQIYDDPATITIRSTENRLLALPASTDYAITTLNEEQEQTIPIYSTENFVQEEELARLGIGVETTETTVSSTTASMVEPALPTIEQAVASDVIGVASEENSEQPTIYLRLVKDQPVTLVFREPTKDMSIVLTDVYSQQYQSLFQWLRPDDVTALEETSESHVEETSSSAEDSDYEAQTEQAETHDERNDTALPPFEETIADENILVVETKETDLTMEELLEEEFPAEDSIITPKLVAEEIDTSEETSSNPIVIKDAKLTMATGTDSFDSHDDPGYDSSPNNDIVRSNDQILYRLGFSIQTQLPNDYTNIRYRVVSTLPNATTLINDAPFINGEIANGTYIDTGIGDGTMYSEGIMESIISTSGQVFVPIVVNVSGAKNGTIMQPTFKLQLIDAININTGELETFNHTYTVEHLANLTAPPTIVSSAPSIAATLVRGEQTTYQIYDPNATNNDSVYNLGLVIELKNLDGRSIGDIRGSTYPEGPITFDLIQNVTGTLGNTQIPVDPSEYDSAQTRFYSVTDADRTTADWQATTEGSPYETTFDPTILAHPLPVPHGKTNELYFSEPYSDHKKIGVFNSGNVMIELGNYQESWEISNYKGIKNIYTYDTLGHTFSNKAFISIEFIFDWDHSRLQELMLTNNWSYYTLNLSIPTLTYDGVTTTNDAKVHFSSYMIPTGDISSGPNFVVLNPPDPITGKIHSWGNQDIGFNTWEFNVGKPTLMRGQKLHLGGWFVTQNVPGTATSDQIFQWNSNGFEYDISRQPYTQRYYPNESDYSYLTYGVRNNGNAMPDLTVPHIDTIVSNYTWYDTPQEAQEAGVISAVRFQYHINNEPTFLHWNGVPIRVIGQSGALDEEGDPYVHLSRAALRNDSGVVFKQSPAENNLTFFPATWAADGSNVTIPYDSSIPSAVTTPFLGTNAFIKNFGIETETLVSKPLYQSDEQIDVKVRGTFSGSEEVDYDSALNTILPKGINYLAGSSKDEHDNPLPDPIIIQHENGETTLRWVFPDSSITEGIEVNFTAISDSSQLAFNDMGLTHSLVIRSVGEMWISDTPEITDTRAESARSSQDQFIQELVQQLTISKSVNKTSIETGNQEMNPLTEADADTSFTYSITSANSALQPAHDFRLMDILPYNGDSRGSSFNGTLEVLSVDIDTEGYTMYYTTEPVEDATNPNEIDLATWTEYTPGSTPDEEIKHATGFMITKPTVPIGESVTLSITVQPVDQLPGDQYRNTAHMNAQIDLPVHSQETITRVYGRELSGFVWLDEDRDGLYDDGEERLANIPVKLYRTSLTHPSEVADQLVEHNLKGTSFVDSNGNATLKTEANGHYSFNYLPEGTYVVEFQIGDQIERKEVAVTIPMVGEDPSINSKANQTTFRTNEYIAEPLANLPGMITTDDSIYHIPYLNLGFVSTLGEIYLYKLEAGTAVDDDQDDQPDINDENQLIGGKKLAGAEFSLHEKESGVILQTKTTDANGRIHFEEVPFGTYELVETTAPDGYELLKQKIEVTLEENNTIVHLFAEDELITELPFAGNSSIMQRVLIAAASLSLIGLIGLGTKYQLEEMNRKKTGGKKDEPKKR
ncbi:SpaA isopeptide-forming pilin-related protein [Enterococcus mundtii]|uniref:SpaA isopeptide-forming pilin-related protein n=1 Tax=Enterococcus mundtii TaxID=53346 RepID=UPI00115BB03D|nr:SpaA isopeptide-forming pilin-related protein [Enterococcus mundtii]